MEIKFVLDTDKATKASVAIVVSLGLCRVSQHTDRPHLAAANAIAIFIVIAILYGPCTTSKPAKK